MSDDSNQVVVQKVYDAFRRKDLAAVLALQSENSEWTVAASPELIPWAAPGGGRDGVSNFLKILGQWLIAEVFEIRSYLANGDTVVALGFQSGTVRPSGKAYAFDFVHVWSVANGLVTKFRVYYDTEYVGSVLR